MKIGNKIRDYLRYINILQSLSETETRKIKRVLRNSHKIGDNLFEKLNFKLNVNDISVVQIMNLRDDIKMLNEITLTNAQKRINEVKFDLNDRRVEVVL